MKGGSPTTRSPPQSGRASKAIVAPPETVYKMAKKIAQLTKVIYFLNTKNEDHDDEIEDITDAYEVHIDQVDIDRKLISRIAKYLFFSSQAITRSFFINLSI